MPNRLYGRKTQGLVAALARFEAQHGRHPTRTEIDDAGKLRGMSPMTIDEMVARSVRSGWLTPFQGAYFVTSKGIHACDREAR